MPGLSLRTLCPFESSSEGLKHEKSKNKFISVRKRFCLAGALSTVQYENFIKECWREIMNLNEFVPLPEAAEITGYSRQYLSWLCRKGQLRPEDVRQISRRWWIRKSALEGIQRWKRRKAKNHMDGEIGTSEMAEILGAPGKPLSRGRIGVICRKRKKFVPSLRKNEQGRYVALRKEVEKFAEERRKARGASPLKGGETKCT